ncbi:MAG: glycerol-3-phosphate cytidylyltransferase [Calditrichaeota bacterium]|nr:MAG: glycerol-3-phosphate cytidylyltransferase [Calditrichota bacterium]
MKKIITYGTFDLFHYGHLRILQRAKSLGDYLIVAVSTDEFNALKGKKCTYPYSHRAQIVEAIKYVDEVIPEENWEQKERDIVENKVDIFVMGNDWKGKFDHLKTQCQVKYLSRTEDISTTEVKHHVKNESSIEIKK